MILGASGYVGGELMRLIDAHPEFELAGAISNTLAGSRIGGLFANLSSAYPGMEFVCSDSWFHDIQEGSDVAFFSAAPHGASAGAIAASLRIAAEKHYNMRVVDVSADFRYSTPSAFSAIYGVEHAAPELFDSFVCAVPEHAGGIRRPHAGHPGCFATAALLAAVPLVAAGLVTDDLYLTGITGSTGSGRGPAPGTHHPERHGNLYAYKPLEHRHAPEIATLVSAVCGNSPDVHFVPHSGPFARGIHMTLQAPLHSAATADDIRHTFGEFYLASPFVHVVAGTPRLKDVVASNQCHIGVAADHSTVTVLCVIDNLVKGAAGGAMQWMNRLWSLPEHAGLMAASPGWT